jgi:GT2 family glycosyltransferase/glycosyltransferase involved in cell wall biosynthesis
MVPTFGQLRLSVERTWDRAFGASRWGTELAGRANQLETLLRGAVWRYSAPARRIEPIGAFLTWLANSTKRPASNATTPIATRSFTLPDAAATLRKLEGCRLALPVSDAPEVSIVIPVFNHFEFTYACLESIAAHTDGPSYEVIVVDDCSHDATPRMLDAIDGVRVVRNPRQLGFIGACNAGAAAARGRYVVLLNNDTEVRDGWLRELRDTFDAEPRAGLVGAKLVYPDGRLQEAGGIVWRNGAAWNVGRLADPNDPRYSYLRRVDYCSGACIMLPTELFRSLSGFDTHYAPAYFEDTDLAFRVRAAGREVFYQPLSQVIHFEGVTAGTDVTRGVKQHQIVNARKFAERWGAQLGQHRSYGDLPELEKDRGARGRVLVVDAVTPEPDRESGGLRMFNLLQVLRGLGFKVTFVASNLANVAGYTAALQRRGIEVLHHPYVASLHRYVRQEGNQYDLIIFSRVEVAGELLPVARSWTQRPRLVFDTVDLHHLREERAAQLAGDADLLAQAKQRREHELRLARMADCTWVVSAYEQQLLQAACPAARVRVVSNIHDVPGCAAPFAARSDLMFLGGFGHPPNTDAVLWLVGEILPRVRKRLPEVKLYVVGNNPPEAVRRLAGDDVIVTGYVADLAPYVRRCRMSVAPLRYGAGVKGKINMSLAHGLPVVATSLAVEGMHLEHEREVLVADDATTFADAVVRLYGDEGLWQALSRNGVTHTERHFSFAAARAAVQHSIEELRASPPRQPARARLFTRDREATHAWIR